MNPASNPEAQSRYQIRFDIGLEGLDRIGGADVIVWVDAFRGVEGAAASAPDLSLIGASSAVLAATLANRSAAAQWILDYQVESGRRVSIAVVTAGSDSFPSADVLAAGAVIDALIARGIDFTSPEAAIACASFEGLRNAVGHLLTASVAGQHLAALDMGSDIKSAAVIDSRIDVEVLQRSA